MTLRPLTATLALALFSLLPANATTPLLENGSDGWKTFSGDEGPGKDWAKPKFDDSKWQPAKAPIAPKDPDVLFLRRTFTIEKPEEVAKITGTASMADGAVLYINGSEFARVNIGDPNPSQKTRARQKLPKQYRPYPASVSFPSDKLVAGENTIAISVHRADKSKDPVTFDLRLTILGAEELRRAKMLPTAKEAVDAYHKKHFVPTDMTIPDGYVDGGTYMKIEEDGTVVATREVIVVDRKRDEKLRNHIEFARAKKDLPVEERARAIAKYVDKLTSPNGNRAAAGPATRRLQDFKNHEMLIGEIPAYCGGGVCRHRSLLFKMLSDEADLKTTIRRGQMMENGRARGRHAWNELILPDGSTMIVDVMNPEPDFRFPSLSEAAHKYGDIKGGPLYDKKDSKEAKPKRQRRKPAA